MSVARIEGSGPEIAFANYCKEQSEFCKAQKEKHQRLSIDQKIRHIANRYGFESQSRQLMEECGELTQAANKAWRSIKGFVAGSEKSEEVVAAEFNLVEEMADVTIMIMQLQELLGISDRKLTDAIEFKLDREIKKINKERGNNLSTK